MNNKLGRRLKYFRERARKSQFKLEVEIEASSGTISRIEQGKVNPTKETVRSIAKVLEMNARELDYLIGITANPASSEEVQIAIDEVKSYFSRKGVFAYLLDERWRFHLVSDSFKKIVNLSEFEVSKMIGKTTVRVIVDEDMPVMKVLSKPHYGQLLNNHIPYYYGQVNFMVDDEYYAETLEYVRRNNFANDIWNSLDPMKFRNYNPQEDRTVYFKIGKFNIPMTFSRESLLRSSRFEVVEYTPENRFLKLLTKLL